MLSVPCHQWSGKNMAWKNTIVLQDGSLLCVNFTSIMSQLKCGMRMKRENWAFYLRPPVQVYIHKALHIREFGDNLPQASAVSSCSDENWADNAADTKTSVFCHKWLLQNLVRGNGMVLLSLHLLAITEQCIFFFLIFPVAWILKSIILFSSKGERKTTKHGEIAPSLFERKTSFCCNSSPAIPKL